MTEAMRRYFERLLAKWEAAGLGLPRAPWDPDVAPWMWQSPPDEDEYAAWRPLPKTERHDLAALAPDLAPLHHSIEEYFNAWWFCALEGQAGSYGVSLTPVMPGAELDEFLAETRGRLETYGRLDRVPLGVEFDGLQVVVDNRTGEVGVEDWETGGLDVVAPGLEALIGDLEP